MSVGILSPGTGSRGSVVFVVRVGVLVGIVVGVVVVVVVVVARVVVFRCVASSGPLVEG